MIYRFNIDRGGTFTDIYCEYYPRERPDERKVLVYKLLSEDKSYDDAPSEGIRRVISKLENKEILEKIPSHYIEYIRMGTTIATNALLERKGEKCALFINEGFSDLLEIGNQSRPSIFDLKILKPERIYDSVFEVSERIKLYQPNETTESSLLRKCDNGETVVIVRGVDEQQIRAYAQEVKKQGIDSVAVALIHSYIFKDHENQIKKILLDEGIGSVSTSSELMPVIKLYPRGSTAVVDSYLTPAIHKYVNRFLSKFSDHDSLNLMFMQSDGGLTSYHNFSGSKAIISGPAGGVVGYSITTSKELKGKPIIGFDMGGTSTDVSRFDKTWDHVFEIELDGIAINCPQIDVNTVASGGGSRLFYRNHMFVVGPESASSNPGPVCYRKDGYLAITDANLILGRIIPRHFPKIFGRKFNEELSYDLTKEAFLGLKKEIDKDKELSVEEIAMGFVKVANETMCRPIRALTQAKGYDARNHILTVFGGAGGQHACDIARILGISQVYIHKYAGILSAYGLSLAEIVEEIQETAGVKLQPAIEKDETVQRLFNDLIAKADKKLEVNRTADLELEIKKYLLLRYDGNDYNIPVQEPKDFNYQRDFEKAFEREYGFLLEKRDIIIDAVRVRVSLVPKTSSSESSLPHVGKSLNRPIDKTDVFFEADGKLQRFQVEVFDLDQMQPNSQCKGPSIILSGTSTIVVDPYSEALITAEGNIILNLTFKQEAKVQSGISNEPIELALFANRFMSIAEQMGRHLQRTAVSTTIKERLDFSCAIFSPDGNLVANAPHLPVHLGAMQEAVKSQVELLKGNWKEGEVILSNHPSTGGSHLPDMTVITPVYHNGKVAFYLANRGHHSDIGGITPGSMPPFSKRLDEEGAQILSFKLVSNGLFDEDGIKQLFTAELIAKSIPPSRNVKDNLSDLKAQVAANNKGREFIEELISIHGLAKVHAYMNFIQDAAEESVRDMLYKFSLKYLDKDLDSVYAEDFMDDGSKICLGIQIDRKARSSVFDFTGTSQQVYSNINTPRSVTSSAIIYCMRCLLNSEIPLNQGCLVPIKINIPENSLLSPDKDCAVVGGNVLTSQRITDIILKAFKACAASQGCMNNFTFGNDRMGYYETIGGGSGAGPTWHGKSGVQVHMTNTRITDVEVLEKRYPVLIENFKIRQNSGGKGKFRGGDGLIRTFRFRENFTVSILSERRVFSPFGLCGGQDGKKGLNLYYKAGKVYNVGGKNTIQVTRGDSFCIMTPGGGGYGEGEEPGKEDILDHHAFFNTGSLATYYRNQTTN